MKIKINSSFKPKNSLNELNLKCENFLNTFSDLKIKRKIKIQRKESFFNEVKSLLNQNPSEKSKVKQLSSKLVVNIGVNPEKFDVFECGNYGLCGSKAISWLLFCDEKFHAIIRHLMLIEENEFRSETDLKRFAKLSATRKNPTEGIMVQDILSLQYNLNIGIIIHYNKDKLESKSELSQTMQELIEDIDINNEVSEEFSTKINLFFESISKNECHIYAMIPKNDMTSNILVEHCDQNDDNYCKYIHYNFLFYLNLMFYITFLLLCFPKIVNSQLNKCI